MRTGLVSLVRRRLAVFLALVAVVVVGGLAGHAATQPALFLAKSCQDNGYTGGQEDKNEAASAKAEDKAEKSRHLTAAQDKAEDKSEQDQAKAEDKREKDCDKHGQDQGDSADNNDSTDGGGNNGGNND